MEYTQYKRRPMYTTKYLGNTITSQGTMNGCLGYSPFHKKPNPIVMHCCPIPHSFNQTNNCKSFESFKIPTTKASMLKKFHKLSRNNKALHSKTRNIHKTTPLTSAQTNQPLLNFATRNHKVLRYKNSNNTMLKDQETSIAYEDKLKVEPNRRIPFIKIRFATPNKNMNKTFYIPDSCIDSCIERQDEMIVTPHRQNLPSVAKQLKREIPDKMTEPIEIHSFPMRRQIAIHKNVVSRNNNSIKLIICANKTRSKHFIFGERQHKSDMLPYSSKPTVVKASPYNIELNSADEYIKQRSFPIGLKIPSEAAEELGISTHTQSFVYINDRSPNIS